LIFELEDSKYIQINMLHWRFSSALSF